MKTPMPEAVKKLIIHNVNEVEEVASTVDFVFSAVDMSKTRSIRLRKIMQKQKHQLYQITVLTAGHRMYRWWYRRSIRSILK